MRRTIVLGMFLGLGEGLMAGQAGRPAGCPVKFQAAVNSGVVERSVGRDVGRAAMGPVLDLRFGEGAGRVVAASVVVRGFSSDGRMLPVNGMSGGPGEPVREQQERFELRAPAAGRLAVREVKLREMQVVRWAELVEVRYADGSVWREGAGDSCRAVPSGFHLVEMR